MEALQQVQFMFDGVVSIESKSCSRKGAVMQEDAVLRTPEASQSVVAAACADNHCCALCCCRKGAVIEEDVVLKTPEDGRVAQLTTDSLVVRLNTLLYVEEQLPAMEKVVMDRCGSPAGTSGSSAPGAVLAVVCGLSSCQGTNDKGSGSCCVLHTGPIDFRPEYLAAGLPGKSVLC